MSEELKTHLLSKVFDNLKKITPALITLDICTGLLIFLPENILQHMRLNLIPDSWYLVISLVFIFCISLTIVIAVWYIFERSFKKLRSKKLVKNLKKKYIALNDEYKDLIIELLQSEEKVLNLNPSSGDTTYLVVNSFIIRSSNLSPSYSFDSICFPYAPQPWLIDLYNQEPQLFQ